MNLEDNTKHRITVLQPGVPSYRVDFFARLAEHFGERFAVHASPLDLDVLTIFDHAFEWERRLGPIRPLPGGAMDWQPKALSVPFSRGDVLVLWGAPRSLTVILTMLRARMRGVKVIWWGHYLSPGSTFWRLALRTALMRRADALLFYTEVEIAAYRATAAGREDPRPVHALNNGIDTSAVDEARTPYRAEEREEALLFIGRLTDKARLLVALEALAQEQIGHIVLHVIGGGDHQDALQAKATNLGIGNRVIWHGGMTDEARIAKVANRCRAFVYPGDVGLSLLHALSYGLPAVLHDHTASHMPEIAALRPGENGETFPIDNAAGLAKVICELISDTQRLNRLSEAALETTRAEFNTARMAERFVACVDDVTGGAGTQI
ncbi:glycosyltransferase family 4 protein [Loktanella salsilacus]|uniref:glycosyltransferase family 4 protein n=1 Tax=Loktanella salsilacus TaxID=195913 RepID=UPI003735EEB8